MRARDHKPRRGLRRLRRETIVPATLAETFAFFADAINLERLTPPWLSFRITSPQPIAMHEGALIEYRISVRGLPLTWRSRIEAWEPGRRFIDRQLTGPYLWWVHEHRFEAVPGGTRVIDDVEYVPRLRWLSGWLVRRDLDRIFRYREQALQTCLTDQLQRE